YVVATEYGDSPIHRTVLACTAPLISVADDAGVAQYGGVQGLHVPGGAGIVFAGRHQPRQPNDGRDRTFIDAFTGVNALGSAVASTGATLVGTEATWLQSTPTRRQLRRSRRSAR
ncbi:MAG: hypothetical protein IPJ61_18220, partial [Tessaracoccus sp.]|uniref:hypothetical protein n=1 Tax=Tessaracoccus sp. TaxID=1971211 RepID=UPI001EC6AAE6